MGQELKVFISKLWPLLVVLFVIPALSFGIWWISPDQSLDVLVLDKTVPRTNYREHSGIFWALDYDKFIKTNGEEYFKEKDYLGFFPSEDKKENGTIDDFSTLDPKDLDELASGADLIYVADTYGVYERDFSGGENEIEINEKIYGGLSQTDIDFLTLAKEKEKTIIAEYNTMASPTPKSIRTQFEMLMGLKWTGWIARFFDELDPLKNGDLPQWLIQNYLSQNPGKWAFWGPGLVFIHESGEIQIMKYDEDFNNETPLIRTPRFNKLGYDLPEVVPYPDWFDIVLIEREYEVISYFDIGVTSQGLERLRAMGLPRFFPAAVVKDNGDGKMFYFSGDFSDMRGNLGSAKFKGLPFLYRGLYVPSNYRDRQSFFWNYYLPLTRQLLANTYQEKN